MQRAISIVSWAVFCCALAIGAAAAEDKDQNAEASAQAETYWGQLLTKCGESYLYKGDKSATLQEFRDVSFEIVPRQLTEADKLNGIRWAGAFTLTAKAHREQSGRSNQWGKWKEGGSLEFKAKDVQGKWHFVRKQFIFRWVRVTFEKPSCDAAQK